MDDKQIISLYCARTENAITETEKKYGSLCRRTAFDILRSDEDAEECVNDTFLKVWESIPPQNPDNLPAFLRKITRNTALHIWEKHSAAKRGAGQIPLALEELQECLPAADDVAQSVNAALLTELLNRFLSNLSTDSRKIFMQRYWYMRSVREIADDLLIGESKVKVSLHRTRKSLKQFLEKEGFFE